MFRTCGIAHYEVLWDVAILPAADKRTVAVAQAV